MNRLRLSNRSKVAKKKKPLKSYPYLLTVSAKDDEKTAQSVVKRIVKVGGLIKTQLHVYFSIAIVIGDRHATSVVSMLAVANTTK